jgi:hypothetical protein
VHLGRTTEANVIDAMQCTPRKSLRMLSCSLDIVREILLVHSSTRLINRMSFSSRYETGDKLTENRPSYPLGLWSMIASHLIEAVLITILGLLLRWENKKRDKIQSAQEGGLQARDLDATAFLDLTDRENLKYVL